MGKWVGAALLSALAMVAASCGPTGGSSSKADSGPATASADPNPAMAHPDKTGWEFFAKAVAPSGGAATFESWATDADTFQATPKFPAAKTPRALHGRALVEVRAAALGRMRGTQAAAAASPHNVGAANCPGPLEDVHRNQAAHDYIVQNNLYKYTGLQAFYGKTGAEAINFPVDSIEVKTNWVKVSDLAACTTYTGTAQDAGKYFYVTKEAGGIPYALVAMHVISKAVPNWTWATFESQYNPSRCDILGCRDTFGATVPWVAPAAQPAQGYPACAKTPALQAMFTAAGITGDSPFNYYCLKGTQTDFVDNSGLAVRLGNSITEAGFVEQASCMTCHGMANFTNQPWSQPTGLSTTSFGFDNNTGFAQVGPVNPAYYWTLASASPTYWVPSPPPGIVQGIPPGSPPQGAALLATSTDFVWAIPTCVGNDTVTPAVYPCAPQPAAPAPGAKK
jgi:hypothetical protein